MNREEILNLPENEKMEILTGGAETATSFLLAELFDSQGQRVYLYDIYGYEHSRIYVSREKFSEEEIAAVVKGAKDDERAAWEFDRKWFENDPEAQELDTDDLDNYPIDEIERLRRDENIYEKMEEISGKDLEERLFEQFGMLRIALQESVFEDGL